MVNLENLPGVVAISHLLSFLNSISLKGYHFLIHSHDDGHLVDNGFGCYKAAMNIHAYVFE